MKRRSKPRKGMRSRSGQFKRAARRRKSPAVTQRFSYTQKPRAKVRYYSKPARRVRRSGIRRANVTARSASLIGAAVAAAAIGASMAALANEAGLLNRAPTQNSIGISAAGLVGIGLVVIGFFVKSEGMKLLFYGFGGGLLLEELTRQIDMRFYDFRVAFGGAPALDYSAGISGAQLQLAATTSATSALPASAPAPALPAAPSAAKQNPTKPLPPKEAAVASAAVLIDPATKEALDTIERKDLDFTIFALSQLSGGEGMTEAIRLTLVDKGAIDERQVLTFSEPMEKAINKLTAADLVIVSQVMENIPDFSAALVHTLKQIKKTIPLTSAGYMDSGAIERRNHEARYTIRRVA